MKRTGPSRTSVRSLLYSLANAGRKQKSGFIKQLADELGKARRKRVTVSIGKLSGLTTRFKKTLVVPGKVLGNGILSEKMNVVALEFSAGALEKLTANGSKTATLESVLEEKSFKDFMLVK